MRFISIITASALVVGALGASLACSAQDRTPQKVAITFKSADLRDPAKAEAVRVRLLKAAQYVCESEGEGPKWREADDRACESEALQKAEWQLARSQGEKLARNDLPPARIGSN
jgi:UrcA family protein